jgi:putative transposase
MSKARFTRNQIKTIVSELDAGRTAEALSLRHGISTSTLYRWRAQCAKKAQPDDGERLRILEVEHRRLKKRLAELTLDYAALRAALVGDVMGDC